MEDLAPHLLWLCADVRPMCGPCHHKGLRPLLETTMCNLNNPRDFFMGCACLLHHGCQSVLHCNMAAALLHPCALQFCSLSHSAISREMHFCFFIQRRQKISLYQHAGSFWHLFPVQRRQSFVMIHGFFIGCRLSFLFSFYLWGDCFNPSPLNWSGWMILCVELTVSMCMLTESVQLCTCISALYQGSLFWRQKGLQPQKAKTLFLVNEVNVTLFCCTIYHFSATFSYHLQTKSGL